MILHWDNSGPLSPEEEAAIRIKIANGEVLTRCELDANNGSLPYPFFEWLLSPDELAARAAEQEAVAPKEA